jgi:hypothetical protein
MNKLFLRYREPITVICLSTYLFITGFCLFHYHQTNYQFKEEFDVISKNSFNSGFHEGGFCYLIHFANNQIQGDSHLIPHLKPVVLLIKPVTSPSLIPTEINFTLRRGPPSLV